MRRFCVAVGLVVATAGSGARAQSEGVAIEWQGPDDCVEADAVRAKVARLLGDRARGVAAETRVVVKVRRETSRYVAVLETTSASGSGRKRLEGESCDAIALASAVVIALAIDPEASLAEEEPPEPVVPPPQAPPPRRAPPPPPPPPAPAPPREVRPYLHTSVGVLFGLLHEPSAFTGAGVGLRYRRLSLEVGGAVYQSREVTRAERAQVGAELRLATGEVLGCYALVPWSLGAVEACPGVRLEYLTASAFGVTDPDEAQVVVGSVLGAARGRLRATSWLSAVLDVGVAARPFQPRFVLRGVGEVYETPAISPLLRMGLFVEF